MEIGIIGAGVIGLTTALVLAEAGHQVTIIAREWPGDDSKKWASPWAGAGILPQPDSKGHDLQTETFIYFWALAHRDPTSGVQVVDVNEYYDDRPDDSTIWYKTLVPKYRQLQASELPAAAKIGFRYQSMTVNPEYFLPWITKRLEERRVRFIRKEVSSIPQARSIIKSELIVNASALGAFRLADDQKVHPVRGQIIHVPSDVQEMILFQGSHYTYQIPRMYTGGVIIGGVAQEGNMDERADGEVKADILKRVNLVLGGQYKDLDLKSSSVKDLVGFRPSRNGGYRLERDGDVIHTYGFGSLGYTYCYGVGLKVRELVEMASGTGSRENKL